MAGSPNSNRGCFFLICINRVFSHSEQIVDNLHNNCSDRGLHGFCQEQLKDVRKRGECGVILIAFGEQRQIAGDFREGEEDLEDRRRGVGSFQTQPG